MPFQGEKFEDIDRVECREGQYGEQICEIQENRRDRTSTEKIRVAGVSTDWSDVRSLRSDGKIVMDNPGTCNIYKSERGDGPDNVKVLQC